MNAIPPVSQAARSGDAAPADASESPAQAPGAGRDFARALSDAGGKPVRKHAAAKQHDAPGGSTLPAPGNQPPLVPPAAPVTQSAAAQVSGGTVPAAATPAVTGADIGSAKAPRYGAAQAAGGPTNAGIPLLDDLAVLPPGAAPATAAPPAAGSAAPAPAAPVTAKDNHATTPPAAAAVPGPKSVSSAAAPLNAADSNAKPDAAPASKADIAAATSGHISTDGSAQANDPTLATGTAAADAAAQAVMAGVMARDTNDSPDSQAPADDLATPDTGVAPQGAVAASDAATPAPPIAAAAHAAAPATAAGGAASAASFAQAMLASAGAGAADKRHDDNTDGSSSGIGGDGSAGAAQLLTSNSPADAAPPPTFKVAAGLDSPDFGQGLADRVTMMVDSNLTGAKLQVNPPALGPIEVRIALQGGHAQVWMSSHSAVTRDALESSAPKLREMLGAQGFGQVSVDISQRSFQERSPQPQAYERLPALGGASAIARTSTISMPHSPNGLLDAYA